MPRLLRQQGWWADRAQKRLHWPLVLLRPAVRLAVRSAALAASFRLSHSQLDYQQLLEPD